MADNNSIKVDELNFDGIKTNLKNFLRGQDQFKDYDFEGSNLSILLDILSYNTYYNSIYNNLSLNEMFIDSASKRESVLSISKALGYTPKSARAARALLEVTVNFANISTVSLSQLTIPKYTSFTSSINDKSYYFYNIEERVAIKNASSSFVFKDLELVEGNPVSQKYIVAPGVRYIISNSNADISTLKVQVSDSTTTGDPLTYIPSTNIVLANPDSRIYFVNEIEEGKFELTFGDGVIGKKLTYGNLVNLRYMVTNGPDANNCRAFVSDFTSFAPGSKLIITTTSAANGGADPETLSSIKFNAPRSFYTQNRAVTLEDFSNVIFSEFDNVESVHGWGGEENIPPVYGKVYLCIRPKNSVYLSEQEKSTVLELVKRKSIITVATEIVDPTYINIDVNSTVYYNQAETVNSANTIADYVKTTIINYNKSDLEKFGAVFKFSKLSRLIDMTEKSIISNITTITLRREVEPKFNINARYDIRLGNPIYSAGVAERSISTTGFYIADKTQIHYMRDNGLGGIVLYYIDGATEVPYNNTIGTVNYKTGYIVITGLNITAIVGGNFEFIIKPQSNDVVSFQNTVINIPTSTIVVNTIIDSTGSTYKFTSSRT
jgi:hypothetical protein